MTIVAKKEFQLTPQSIALAVERGYTKENGGQAKPIILETVNGEYLALFHHWKGAVPPKFAYMAKVKWVVCCHPEHLPMELRIKHVFPNWRGEIGMYPFDEGDTLLTCLLQDEFYEPI